MLHTVVSDRRKAVRPGPDRRKAVRYRAVGSALVGLIAIGVATPAQAQIYSWRDANGNLVLSNRRSSASSTAVASASSAVASAIVQKAPLAATARQTTLERGWAYTNLIAEHSRLQGVRADLVRA